MACQDLKTTIREYLDGELSSTQREVFEFHLRNCSHCRREVQELKSTLVWLKQAEEVTPPPDLRNRVLARIEKDKAAPARRFALRLPKVVAAAAVFILLVAGNMALVRLPVGDDAGIPVQYGKARGTESVPMAEPPAAEDEVGVAVAPEISKDTFLTIEGAAEPPARTAADREFAREEAAPWRSNALYIFLLNLFLLPLFAALAIQAARERRLT